MWEISKTFEFCYGHRVWSQELDENFALTKKNKCRHLHGHEAKVIIHLASDSLDEGMVTDFNHLNWLKTWIDGHIDHKFIIDLADPLFTEITNKITPDEGGERLWVPRLIGNMIIGRTINDRYDNELDELFDSFFVVDFVPTSENLANWMYNIVNERMPGLVSGVEWHETPKSKAVFRRK